MATQNDIRNVMEGHTLVPVVTFNDQDDPLAFMRFLIDQNVRCIEVTLRTEAGLRAIGALKQEFGNDALIGAGTVTRPEHVQSLKEVGADFLVSPGLTQDLLNAMQASGIPYLPGVSTPSEIMQAIEWGLDTLKFFPAHLPAY